MGKESKRSLGDAIKSKIDVARVETAKATDIGLDKLRDASVAAANTTARAGKAGFETLKDGSSAAVKGAVAAKSSLDAKTRAALDRAQEGSRKIARENVERLRGAHPDATPADILDYLEEDLKSAEKTSGGKTGEFVSAAALFVFSALEIHGEKVKSPDAAQKLIDAVFIADHEVTKNVVKYGGGAIAIAATFTKKLGPIGQTATKLARLGTKAGAKLALITSIASLAGIKNSGKQSVTWVLSASTRKILGEPPQTWASGANERK